MPFTNNFFAQTSIKVVLKYFEMRIDGHNYDQPLQTYASNIFDLAKISKINKVNLDFSLYEFENEAQILFGKDELKFFLRTESKDRYSYY